MPGRRSLITILALAIVFVAPSAFAQKKDTRSMLRLMGDGAAECSAAKRAAALRAPRNHFSIASDNFDATYYHLDLFFPMDTDSVRGTVRIEGRVINSTMTQLTLDLADSPFRGHQQAQNRAPVWLCNDFEGRLHASKHASLRIYVSRHIKEAPAF